MANGDMVTMTLLQGVLNTFVVAFSQVVGYVAGRAMASDEDEAPSPFASFASFAVTTVAQVFAHDGGGVNRGSRPSPLPRNAAP